MAFTIKKYDYRSQRQWNENDKYPFRCDDNLYARPHYVVTSNVLGDTVTRPSLHIGVAIRELRGCHRSLRFYVPVRAAHFGGDRLQHFERVGTAPDR